MAGGGKGSSGSKAPASSSGAPASSSEPKKYPRFSEPAKFFPVAFVVSIIVGLIIIYVGFHLVPMFQFDIDAEMQNHKMKQRAIVEGIVFSVITLLLIICYVKSTLVHPGEIPGKEQDPYWEYVPADGHTAGEAPNLQESKRSGERRYCKWCAKYKPDRCHHCRVCRTCILKMDHHCPWIYNCVGFKNHKFFFLLLFYSVLDCHLIMWTMVESVKTAVEVETPFMTMFLLLFGETLASFLGMLVTAFFCFHIWLMLKAMTTIEFCEKSLKKTGYNTSVYDHDAYGNIITVLGSQPLLWFLPVSPPIGDGLNFVGEHSRLSSKFLEPDRGGLRRVGHKKVGSRAKSKSDGSGSDAIGSEPPQSGLHVGV